MILTTPQEVFDAYVKKDGKQDGHDYARRYADECAWHVYGTMPKRLLEERRPNEPEEIQKYRRKIYVPKTKTFTSRVIATLARIRNAEDYVVSWPAGSEELQQYCNKELPYYDSIEDFVFADALTHMLADPNGLLAFLPLQPESLLPENEKPAPYPVLVKAEHVCLFHDKVAAVWRDERSVEYTQGGTTYPDGKQFWAVMRVNEQAEIWNFRQIGTGKDGILYDNGTLWQTIAMPDDIPVIKLGGRREKSTKDPFNPLYSSFLDGALPALNEAIRIYSDFQACMVVHAFPEAAIYAQDVCTTCNGRGHVDVRCKDGEEGTSECREACKPCNGSGVVLGASPYGLHVVRAPTDVEKVDGNVIPFPHKVYIDKDYEGTKLQGEEYKNNLLEAADALHMGFLTEAPAAQSGIAKAYDRTELNAYLQEVARRLVGYVLQNAYFSLTYSRFGVGMPGTIANLQPSITVPIQFDDINALALEATIQSAKAGGASALVIQTLEDQLMQIRYRGQDEKATYLHLVNTLDPLYGIPEGDKALMVSGGGTTKVIYVISCNIRQLVREALSEDPNFARLSYPAQMQVLKTKAAAIIAESSAANDVLNAIPVV